MRRSEREITDQAQIEEILRKGAVVYLGIQDADAPYVVPLNFGYADGALFVHAALEGHKIDLLCANPRVSFAVAVDDAVIPGEMGCKWSARYRSVLGKGTAVFVDDHDAKIRAFDTLLGKFAAGPFTYAEDVLARTVVIRIDIETMTGKQAGY